MAAEGSCVCGAVRYEVDGSLGDVSYCHCNQCRRTTGTFSPIFGRVAAEPDWIRIRIGGLAGELDVRNRFPDPFRRLPGAAAAGKRLVSTR
jgi:hypothetical protein